MTIPKAKGVSGPTIPINLDQVCVFDKGRGGSGSDGVFSNADDVYSADAKGNCTNNALTIQPIGRFKRSPEISDLFEKLNIRSLKEFQGINLYAARDYLLRFRLAEKAFEDGNYTDIYGHLFQAMRIADSAKIRFNRNRAENLLKKISLKEWMLQTLNLLTAADEYTFPKIAEEAGTIPLKYLPVPKQPDTIFNERVLRRSVNLSVLRMINQATAVLNPVSNTVRDQADFVFNPRALRTGLIKIAFLFTQENMSKEGFDPSILARRFRREPKGILEFLEKPDGEINFDLHIFEYEERLYDSPERDSLLSIFERELFLPSSIAEEIGAFFAYQSGARYNFIYIDKAEEYLLSIDSLECRRKALDRLKRNIENEQGQLRLKVVGSKERLQDFENFRMLVELSH